MNGGQFPARFIGDVLHFSSVAIPIAGIARIAFDLVQHGVDPRRVGVVLELLDNAVRGIPFTGDGKVNGAEQIGFRSAHSFVLATNKPSRKPPTFAISEAVRMKYFKLS